MSLAPKLKKIRVATELLLLDPNNPRLFTQQTERVPLKQVQLPGFQSDTEKRIVTGDDKFRVRDLVDSIKANGYVPEAGGYIFVRKMHGSELYLVLEGNRRLVAIRQLRPGKGTSQAAVSKEVIESLETIDVLEIVDDLPEEKIQEKISYLLGTCHHGSQKSWSPFAQARGIYERYIKQTGQDDTTFSYDSEKSQEVASILSIKESEVKERLTVYRAMQQLAATDEMKSKPHGGIIDDYYSLVGEAVCARRSEIKNYIPKNPDTFTLEAEAIQRMVNLCNFDGTKERKYKDNGGSTKPAMTNPKQWRYLGDILADSNSGKRLENLAKVEEEHQQPEEVWARRSAELRQYTWKKWLEQVYGILSEVGMGATFDEPAKTAINDTLRIVDTLGEGSGGHNA